MQLRVELQEKSYDIHIEQGLLDRVGAFVNLNRKVMVVSDSGVPATYRQRLLDQCPQGYIFVAPQGEGAKSLVVYEQICRLLLAQNFSRADCIIALGGGVVGDLAGFVAATYMRGVDFINIPTTTLAQIDSSIGGKVAVNLEGYKNVLGAFYQPAVVLIDPSLLATLPPRHYVNGLAEAIKAGLIYDEELFGLLETGDVQRDIKEIIYRALRVKKAVVEQDEKERGLRMILNFGHTIGHGVESVYGLQGLLHGEAVAIGMALMLEPGPLRQRLIGLCEKLGLPHQAAFDAEAVFGAIHKDKKAAGEQITVVTVPHCGQAELRKIDLGDLLPRLKKAAEEQKKS